MTSQTAQESTMNASNPWLDMYAAHCRDPVHWLDPYSGELVRSWLSILGAGVALVILLDVLYNVLNGLRIHVFSFQVDLKKKFGDWAVVTGSTDGIGKAYAHELARRGLNIILISRSLDKLKNVASEIECQHGVQTRIIAVDLSQGKESVEAVKKLLGDEEVGILVNNVGCAIPYTKWHVECTEKEIWDQVLVNVGFTTLMTRLILPDMRVRGRGAVVLVGSITELFPWPMNNVYAATKIYIKYFFEGLRMENSNSGITFQRLTPGLVNTKMTDSNRTIQQSVLFGVDPIKFGRSAVNTLGKTTATTGYWKHGILYYILARLPPALVKLSAYGVSIMSRKIYFKQEQKKKETFFHHNTKAD